MRLISYERERALSTIKMLSTMFSGSHSHRLGYAGLVEIFTASKMLSYKGKSLDGIRIIKKNDGSLRGRFNDYDFNVTFIMNEFDHY